ncbi:hypothetical protein ACR79B_22650, partial [Sphingobacterium spiritivorum]|uniref:hypothetical protein n=1 Tax=Sphingobacterium spiritivorum TaxID=258 RepID=UPI003DA286BC
GHQQTHQLRLPVSSPAELYRHKQHACAREMTTAKPQGREVNSIPIILFIPDTGTNGRFRQK